MRPGRFTATAGITAFAVLNDFSRAIKSADLADAGDIAAIPFKAELEIWIRVEARGINGQLGHRLWKS